MATTLAPVPFHTPIVGQDGKIDGRVWGPWLAALVALLNKQAGLVLSGTGAPNGSVYGSPPQIYLREDGGAGTTLYVKESGVNTTAGWVSK